MAYDTLEAIQRLVTNRICESSSLEFKAALNLTARGDRIELLKDLSGMANGGGGAVIFGVSEDSDDNGVASDLTPLTNRTLTGVVEDVVRSCVRPPLLMRLRTLDVEDGYFLVAEVEGSSLGPYMVDGLGRHEYYRRSGTRTHPMNEQEVRDAYALAVRTKEHRSEVWADHSLPITLPEDVRPCVSLSGLPQESLRELLDLKKVDLVSFLRPNPLGQYVNQMGLDAALRRMQPWADGLYGDGGYNPPEVMVRFHRNGAVGLWRSVHPHSQPLGVSQVMNCMLAYSGWFWTEFDLRGSVELKLRFDHLDSYMPLLSNTIFGRSGEYVLPPGVTQSTLELSVEANPEDLLNARARHALLRRFADRIMNAYASSGAGLGFDFGHLFGRDGFPSGFILGAGAIWGRGPAPQQAWLRDDDAVMNTYTGVVVGFVGSGVIIDTDGNTVALVEFASGQGCSERFFAGRSPDDEGWPLNDFPPQPALERFQRPAATGEWSGRTLTELLAPG